MRKHTDTKELERKARVIIEAHRAHEQMKDYLAEYTAYYTKGPTRWFG